MASVTGPPEEVAAFVGVLSSSGDGLPAQAEVLGPVPVDAGPGVSAETRERALIRISRGDGLELARALHTVQATRSARKDGGAIRVQLDPAEVA
jgi:primosomal protein N' (replication factor Y)